MQKTGAGSEYVPLVEIIKKWLNLDLKRGNSDNLNTLKSQQKEILHVHACTC